MNNKVSEALLGWSCVVALCLGLSDLACWLNFLTTKELSYLIPALGITIALIIIAVLLSTTDWSK